MTRKQEQYDCGKPRGVQFFADADRQNRIYKPREHSEDTSYPISGSTVIYTPTTFEDVEMLIDHLRRKEQLIVDFYGVNQTLVSRILDFMSGAVYALGGTIRKITANIFLFVPFGVAICEPPRGQVRRN